MSSTLPLRKKINGFDHELYSPERFTEEEMLRRSTMFYQMANSRRSVRTFSNQPVPVEVMENIIKTAGTSPSGANKQPWTFCLVSNPVIKKSIRVAAEKEEYENYKNRMGEEWLHDLKAFATNWEKPFLETAPYLIIAFRRIYENTGSGEKKNNYYVTESIGLACGMLLLAIHHAGLVALTHTPSPMNFLTKILERPENERPFLLIPVGYPADALYVPSITRKSFDDICIKYA